MPERLARARALKYAGKPALVRARRWRLLVAVNKSGKSCKAQRGLWQGCAGAQHFVPKARITPTAGSYPGGVAGKVALTRDSPLVYMFLHCSIGGTTWS